ncbi:MAG: N-acetylglutaminylglutamine synthetase [Actinomycetota bacterium]
MTEHATPGIISARPWSAPDKHLMEDMKTDVDLDMGWGRLVFGQTFASPDRLRETLKSEERGRRDICLYPRDPHVVVAEAPHELFIDPSYTYRLNFATYHDSQDPPAGITIRAMRASEDADSINRVYAACGMVTAPVDTIWHNQRTRTFIYLVAEDLERNVVGTVTGVDHAHAFNDPEQGSSLWCLAVDPGCTMPGVGEALVRALVGRFIARGRAYLDLSVMADNKPAIGLYEKLGFERVPVFCVKRKNPINEPLFIAPADDLDELNPYARIIADEARRRGITVEVVDAEGGIMRLSLGGRTVMTRESLSEMTSAVAMSMCDDKRVTRRVLEAAGLRIPAGRTASGDDEDLAFLAEHGSVVVKPARGEQGAAVTVGVTTPKELREAIARAEGHCQEVLLEEMVPGDDLRIVVIDHEVVAAAVRRPARVVGNGRDGIKTLIEAQSRRRSAATGGESSIPIDEVTIATVRGAGYELTDVLGEAEELQVRLTANLHTGGTIHDVTEELHPDLIEAAVRASHALSIPVVGLDLMVVSPDKPDHVFIEANERPGLANHEPQPTAQRFIDLLFPSTRELPRRWSPPRPGAGHHVEETH